MNSIRFKNVRSFVDTFKINIKPLTILVGPNSSGKSSFLRFPAVLAQTAQESTDNPLTFFGPLLDYGNFKDVVNKRDDSKEITFSFSYELNVNVNTQIKISDYDPRFNDIHECTLEVSVCKDEERKSHKMIVNSLMFYVGDKILFALERNDQFYVLTSFYLYYNSSFNEENYKYKIKNLEWMYGFFPSFDNSSYFPDLVKSSSEEYALLDDDDDSFESLFYEIISLKGNELLSGDKAIIRNKLYNLIYIRTLLKQFSVQWIRDCRGLSYIGPFRENPERVYRDSLTPFRKVGARGQHFSSMLVNDYYKDREIINKVSGWINKNFGYSLDIKTFSDELYQVTLLSNNNIESNLLDVGYGISQVLPITTQIIYDLINERMMEHLLLIEQPELHLHPAGQANLADLFSDFVCAHRRKNFNTLIVETHSEHLIRKIQVLISDPKNRLTSDRVAIYYFDKDENDETTIKELRLTEQGRFIDEWPKGFFDKSHELSVELMNNIIGLQ